MTFAQAQERAEQWVNGEVASAFHREVRVREFALGFVAWAEDRDGGPVADGGRSRLVIARDSGETTLWPGLPVGEVIRRYEEEYGAAAEAGYGAAEPPQRIDLEATSFLLTPPEWLQEAADTIGIGGRKPVDGGTQSGAEPGDAAGVAAEGSAGEAGTAASTPPADASSPSTAPSSPSSPSSSTSSTSSTGTAEDAAAAADAWADVNVNAEPAPTDAPPPAAPPASPAPTSAPSPSGAAAVDDTPWAAADTTAGGDDADRSVAPPQTVFAPPLAGSDDEDTPSTPRVRPDAKTELLHGGSQLPRTKLSPALPPPAPDVPGRTGPGGTGGPPPMPSAPPPMPPAPPAPSTTPSALRDLPPPTGTPIADVPPPPGAHVAATMPADGSALPGNAPGASGAAATAGAQETDGRPGDGPASPGPGATGAPAGGYVPTQMVSQLDASELDLSAVDGPVGAAGPGGPGAAGSGAGGRGGGVHAAATMLADGAALQAAAPGPGGAAGGPGGPGGAGVPGMPPPPPPGPLGAPKPSGGKPAGAAGGTAPGGQGGPPPPLPPPPAPQAGAGGGVHAAATMLADGAALSGAPDGPPAAGPGMPPGPPMAPPAPPGPQPGPPGVPGPGVPGPGGQGAPGGPGGQGASGAYGYPPAPSGQPTVGPGYMAVLSYRAPDGSEQKIVRRSAPGTPHPEWQLLHELRAMNVPPQQVVELHTELECCDLPGGYCARMIRETWPQVRISHTAAYGKDHASRQQGVRHLIEHQGELHQVADGPARPAPVRAPLPHPSQVQPVPPAPPQAIGHELEQAFGPQGVFRFDQRAVSRQGVPDVVAQTLVWAGLPVDFGPFFWAQAQPGRPVPTLAELAMERRVQPSPDAGSYLVMGNDFGRQLCVQYGTAHIVAVPLEAGPGGQSVAPQFVNSGLPEFVRCLAMLGRMWRLRYGLTPDQAGRWTVDFQAQLVALDPPALGSPETWWSVLLEQMWDGLL